ncbi:MAG: hypothetical protein R3B54_00195 [Bdellovibrionota bacterium]
MDFRRLQMGADVLAGIMEDKPLETFEDQLAPLSLQWACEELAQEKPRHEKTNRCAATKYGMLLQL